MQTTIKDKNGKPSRKYRVREAAPSEVVRLDGHLDAQSARGLMRAIGRLLYLAVRLFRLLTV